MKNYMMFDVDGFFRDYGKNKRRLRDLKWEKAQAMSQGGMDYSKPRVTGGLPTSQVETMVERMSVLDAQIDDLNEYFAKADEYLNSLASTEKQIAEVYFIQGKKGVFAIDDMCNKLYMSKSSVYRAIKNIRVKIRNYAEKKE